MISQRDLRRRLIRYLARGGRVTRRNVGAWMDWSRACGGFSYRDTGERLKRQGGFVLDGKPYKIRKEPKTASTYKAVAQ